MTSSTVPSKADLPRISVVAPCYNEELVVPDFLERMQAALLDAASDDYEIVLVNDGSRDRTWDVICGFTAQDRRVVGVDLSRNFGHQLAISAGLAVCRGDLILVIDSDLQDPPELLKPMLDKIDEGADVVHGQRLSREGETAFKRGTAKLFYAVIDRLSEVKIHRDVGDFKLMRRVVVDELLKMPEENRFIRGMVAWIGFRQVLLPYHRERRKAGTSKYPLLRMMRLATDAITSFSTIPLRLTSLFGVIFFIVSFFVGLYSVLASIFLDTAPGWASIVALVSFVGGIQLVCLGIIGEYLGRIYMEVKRRPLYIIREITAQPLRGHDQADHSDQDNHGEPAERNRR